MSNEMMDGLSMDIENVEQEKLRSLFPQCFVDGQLSVTKLLETCGVYDTVDENDREKYEFRWKGKQEAQQLAGKRSAGALRPCLEESVNWDTTQNLYIEGDNLEVLKLLQRTYFRKVKMIYIDPPYNTGNDFVYADDFADPLARYREITGQTTKSNPEAMGRFHTNWLNMMYPRLRLAANLLRDDGVIIISIDDAEVENLKKICNEILGEENFVACLIYDKNRKNDAKYFSVGHEYMLVYFKSIATMTELGVVFRANKEGVEEVRAEFERLRKLHNDDWNKVGEELKMFYSQWASDDPRKPLARYTKVDEFGPYRDDGNINWPGSGGSHYDVIHPVTGKPVKKPVSGWRYSPERLLEEVEKGHVVFGVDETTVPRVRSNLFEADKQVMRSVHFSYAQTATQEFNKLLDGVRVFENPKHVDDIKKLIAYVTTFNNREIVLDFFSGSATTAHAVMQLNAEDGGNRQFIMVQLPEVTDDNSEAHKAGYKTICEIGKERIRRAGAKIVAERGEQLAIDNTENAQLDIGFKVFKLDSSNLKIWDDSPISGEDALNQLEIRLKEMLDIIKSDRSELDIVYEIILKLGQELTKPVIPIDINGKTVFGVGTGNDDEVKFIICFAPNITPEDADAMAEYAPGRIIFANACFGNSEEKTNVKLTLKDKGIAMKAL